MTRTHGPSKLGGCPRLALTANSDLPLHRVVDGQAGGDRTARAVDVQADVLVGILALKEEHLRDDHVGDVVVQRRTKEDDAVLEEPRVDVVSTTAM